MAVYQIFSHAEDYINYFIAGMIVLTFYWYAISRRRRLLAEFINDSKTKRVYKLDNTIACKGMADIKLKGFEEKPRRAYLRANIADGVPQGWALSTRGDDSVINLEDGKSYDLFGLSYVFRSYLGTHKPYGGHFISIILIAAFSLIIQIYFSVYAGFEYINIDSGYGLKLAAFFSLSREMDYWISFFGLLSLEALIWVIISIANPRRITPEIILFFFLSYIGFLLFPNINTLIYTAVGWCIWSAVPPFLSKLLSKTDKHSSLFVVMRGTLRIPAILLTTTTIIILLAAALIIGSFINSGPLPYSGMGETLADTQAYSTVDLSIPIQVQQTRAFSAAGGQTGLGLYNGHFRIDSPQSKASFITGVVFEELGMNTGILLIVLILLTAYGCYFQGVRAEKYHFSVICSLIAIFIALCAMINLASITGVSFNLMELRFNMPVVELPMPFLSSGGTLLSIVLFIGMILVESVKLSWTIKPAASAVFIEPYSQHNQNELISDNINIENYNSNTETENVPERDTVLTAVDVAEESGGLICMEADVLQE